MLQKWYFGQNTSGFLIEYYNFNIPQYSRHLFFSIAEYINVDNNES